MIILVTTSTFVQHTKNALNPFDPNQSKNLTTVHNTLLQECMKIQILAQIVFDFEARNIMDLKPII